MNRSRLQKGSPRLGVALLLLAAAGTATLLVEGSRPGLAAGVHPIPHFDKLLHFGAHAVLAGLAFWGGLFFAKPEALRRRAAVWAALVLLTDAVAGLAVEVVQRWLGASYGRRFDLKDVAADIAGAAFSVCVSAVLVLWAARAKR